MYNVFFLKICKAMCAATYRSLKDVLSFVCILCKILKDYLELCARTMYHSQRLFRAMCLYNVLCSAMCTHNIPFLKNM